MPPTAMKADPAARLGKNFPKWANTKQARKLLRHA